MTETPTMKGLDATSVDSLADIEKINFQEISCEKIMRKSRVVRNASGEILQQTFLFHKEAAGYENVGYSRRDVYNEQFKQIENMSSDADDALDFLKGLCSKDEMMYWRHTINDFIICFGLKGLVIWILVVW
ncbi:hypothetical protein TSUD_98510 [Trifolium subterraneum]|uniref:Uncharacterized protein n=1 Tax=Trifolium subterraneum TaxID=3900 RepID=A0A2Z6NI45_TRISU|nr:hypothetical protein TSUD_98510 [Trifolium subterraneum]